MADQSTLASRMSAAHAVTATQAGKPAGGTAEAPKAPSSSPSLSPASSTDAGTDSNATPASSESSTAPSTSASEQSGADGEPEAPATPAELKRQFTALDKRQRKLKREKRELGEKAKQIDAARNELIAENSRVSALLRHADEKHGWVAKGQGAWDNDDKVGFAKAVEKMAKGASLASITRWLAGVEDKPAGAAKPSGEEESWRREKAEWERSRAADAAKADGSKTERASAEKRDQAKGRLAVAFAKHPFLVNPDDPKKADPDALGEAFQAYESAFKAKAAGETARDVAKRVLDGLHARELRRAKKLGLAPTTPATPPAKPTNGKGTAKDGERLPPPPPSNKTAKQPTLDETRAARMAAAKRMTELQRRGVV